MSKELTCHRVYIWVSDIEEFSENRFYHCMSRLASFLCRYLMLSPCLLLEFIQFLKFTLVFAGRKCLVYPHVLPAPIQELNWAGIIQPEDMLYPNHLPLHVGDEQPFSGSFCSYRKGRQLPFIQDDATAFGITTMAQSTCLQPLLKNTPPSAESSSKILCDRIQQVHSDCALSLLSSSTQNPGIALSQMLPAGRIPMHQSLLSSLPYGNLGLHSSSQASSYVSPASFSCSGVENEQVGMVFACGADTDLHCQSVFHVPEGSSEGVSQTFPFCWQ